MRFTITFEAPEGMLPHIFEDLVRSQLVTIKAYLQMRGSLIRVTTVSELEDDCEQ